MIQSLRLLARSNKLLAAAVLLFISLDCLSQHVTRNNYSGSWETPSSWNPQWAIPVKTNIGESITIFGSINASGSLSFQDLSTTLTVNDTLVINGDLNLSNRNFLIINDGGILVIRGNLVIDNKTEIRADNYLVVFGDIIKTGSVNQGSATSNDIPSQKVFITGNVSHDIDDDSAYPIFDNHPAGSGFGKLDDLMADPIWNFLQALCGKKVTSNSPICEGETLLLHAEGGKEYNWTGPGGFTSELQDPSVSNAGVIHSGTYSVFITGAGGCPNETKSITVEVNPLPPATATVPAVVCTGTRFTLGASGGNTYSWTGPAGFASNLQNPEIPVANSSMSGIYYVTVTDSRGCKKDASGLLSVKELPDVTVGSNSPVCSGKALNLTTTGGSTYRWTGPSGFSSEAKDPVISNIAGSGAGTYTVTVTDASGCARSVGTTVIVNPLPSVTVSGNSPVCRGKEINLTSTVSASSVYLWAGPAGFTGSASSAILADAGLQNAGRYTLTVTDQNGCVSSAFTDILVNDLPQVSITADRARMCADESQLLAGSPAGGSFRIVSGPGSLSGNRLSSTGQGPIVVEYTYSGSCTNRVMSTIESAGRPVSLPGADQSLKNIFETVLNAVLPPASSGTWSVVSGSGNFIDPASPSTTVKNLSVGENIFSWTVSNGICEVSSELRIEVLDLFVPTVITPNGDGRNDRFTVEGLSENTMLIIVNKWGETEYMASPYRNDWDGRNRKGVELPEDTYFYILDPGNGRKYKGTIMILR